MRRARTIQPVAAQGSGCRVGGRRQGRLRGALDDGATRDASAAPPIRYQNVYGIDMAATTELVAHQRSEEDIQDFIKADWLIYQDLDDLIMAAQAGNEEIKQFECSIFNGKYVTDDIDDKYLRNLEDVRNDKSKSSRQPS